MKRQLFPNALPVCPFVVAAQRERASAPAAASRGNGFDGAHPGAPVP